MQQHPYLKTCNSKSTTPKHSKIPPRKHMHTPKAKMTLLRLQIALMVGQQPRFAVGHQKQLAVDRHELIASIALALCAAGAPVAHTHTRTFTHQLATFLCLSKPLSRMMTPRVPRHQVDVEKRKEVAARHRLKELLTGMISSQFGPLFSIKTWYTPSSQLAQFGQIICTENLRSLTGKPELAQLGHVKAQLAQC